MSNTIVKSPLRYPGGKSRAIKQIMPLVPEFKEFREPMVGGGSVFFALKQKFPNRKFWINDVNYELYIFWKICRDDINGLLKTINEFKTKFKNGRELYKFLFKKKDTFTEVQKAARFFILNRITFSGLAESGGYAPNAFKERFTESSIKRLIKTSELLKNTKITNEDYEKSLTEPGEEVFIFLDPPYISKTHSKLYGKDGVLHTGFDHTRFAEEMKKCKHKWLITYDDSPEVRKLFSFAEGRIIKFQLQYGMNNFKQRHAEKGKELFIMNYDVSKTLI
jgi:DNA adenine methylase